MHEVIVKLLQATAAEEQGLQPSRGDGTVHLPADSKAGQTGARCSDGF